MNDGSGESMIFGRFLDVIDVLAWPLSIAVALVVVATMLKGPLARLVHRVKFIGGSGVAFQHSEEPRTEEEQRRNVEELMATFNQQTVHDQEQRIFQELDQRQIVDSNERVRVLVRHLAGAQMVSYFVTVSAHIWQSQISLLQHLSQRPKGTASIDELEPFYWIAQAGLGTLDVEYPMTDYLEFLRSHGR